MTQHIPTILKTAVSTGISIFETHHNARARRMELENRRIEIIGIAIASIITASAPLVVTILGNRRERAAEQEQPQQPQAEAVQPVAALPEQIREPRQPLVNQNAQEQIDDLNAEIDDLRRQLQQQPRIIRPLEREEFHPPIQFIFFPGERQQPRHYGNVAEQQQQPHVLNLQLHLN